MKKDIRVIASKPLAANERVIIEIDNYVPCRVRTYAVPIGAYYLRIGNFKTSLLELILEPISGLIRGITLTSFNEMVERPQISCVAKSSGLPVLDMGKFESRSTDIVRDFKVSLDHDLIVFWKKLEAADSLIETQALGFYLMGDELIGCQVLGLNGKQIEAIRRDHM